MKAKMTSGTKSDHQVLEIKPLALSTADSSQSKNSSKKKVGQKRTKQP